ncbi:hypothetical protein [Muricoccus radiodurans]|uniref:hypothetical protein n=1 Tax=Muricoccus radiodurans TaxID=2231721 RepID=UPI003CF3878A
MTVPVRAGVLDDEDLRRQARERCRPGVLISVHAHRGTTVRRDAAAAVVCEGGLFDEVLMDGTPWLARCRYRAAALP